jgi:hypothetical protein
MNKWLHSFGRGLLALGALAVWTVSGAASPQQEPESANNRVLVSKFPNSDIEQPRQLRQPYEDIEIYRRLLLKQLQPYVNETIKCSNWQETRSDVEFCSRRVFHGFL